MGKKDPEVLSSVLPGSVPFLTSDFRIISDHRSSVCEPNSGIIIVRTNDTSRPFTLDRKMELVKKFKEHYSAWFTQDWANVQIEIYDDYVFIARLSKLTSETGRFFGFGDCDFESAIKTFIDEVQRLSIQFTAANTLPTPG